MKSVTCLECGWGHFEVSRKFAEKAIIEFNTSFNSLSLEDRDQLYSNKPSSLALYEKCHFCQGPYKNFRDAIEGDIPYGCTMGPIIKRNE